MSPHHPLSPTSVLKLEGWNFAYRLLILMQKSYWPDFWIFVYEMRDGWKVAKIYQLSRRVFFVRGKIPTLLSDQFPPSPQTKPPDTRSTLHLQSLIFAIRSSLSFLHFTSNFFLSFKARELKFGMKKAWISIKMCFSIHFTLKWSTNQPLRFS